jgi:hypothetical protein
MSVPSPAKPPSLASPTSPAPSKRTAVTARCSAASFGLRRARGRAGSIVGLDAIPARPETVDRLHRDRDAELAQRVLVALEPDADEEQARRDSGLDTLRELVEGERAACRATWP